jgi:3-methylcrotonyl-CoA carboxylase alpha subunit
VLVDGARMSAELGSGSVGLTVRVAGKAAAQDAVVVEAENIAYVLRGGRQTVVRIEDVSEIDAGQLDSGGLVMAPMHGKVLAILVEKGAAVHKGQRLAVIEAMKMEHALTAPCDGVVAEVAVAKDGQVAEGAKVMTITPAEKGEGAA